MDNDERARIEREIRAKAMKKVGATIAFRWHLFVFVLVNVALAAINLTGDTTYLWFIWPLCGWGAGLAMHAYATFTVTGMAESMIEAEVQRELAKRGLSPQSS